MFSRSDWLLLQCVSEDEEGFLLHFTYSKSFVPSSLLRITVLGVERPRHSCAEVDVVQVHSYIWWLSVPQQSFSNLGECCCFYVPRSINAVSHHFILKPLDWFNIAFTGASLEFFTLSLKIYNLLRTWVLSILTSWYLSLLYVKLTTTLPFYH